MLARQRTGGAVGRTYDRPFIGVIEGGGTKFVCAVGEDPAALTERVIVPTTDAATTLQQCREFFAAAVQRHRPLSALGIGCFGPLQLRRESPEYGCLLATPKRGWSGVSVLAPFAELFNVPTALDTDVGAAALGELRHGAGIGLGSLAYVTVGTGVGGAVAPGSSGSRLMHAEMGHLLVRRDARDADFSGVCPFHGDCLEGLASGPAIRARWNCDLASLSADHPGRSIIAGYIGQLAASIILMHAPEALVLGGGVMSDGSLLPAVRESAASSLRGYAQPLRDATSMHAFIRAPSLAADSAITGAAVMALELLDNRSERQ